MSDRFRGEEISMADFSNYFPAAHDSWASTLIEGNAILPQYGTAMSGLAAEAVVNDPPADWQEFEDSVLTENQLRKVGEVMSAMHRSGGVAVAMHDTADKFVEYPQVRTIGHERLQILWKQTVEHVLRMLYQYVEDSKNFTIVLTDDPVTTLNSFFRDQRNAESIKQLHRIVTAVGEIFRGAEMKALTYRLRKTYDSREVKSSNHEEEQKRLHKEVIDLFDRELKEKLPDVDKRILNKFRMVADKK